MAVEMTFENIFCQWSVQARRIVILSSVLQCVAMCCSVYSCSVLQHVAVCCSVFQWSVQAHRIVILGGVES